MSIADKITRLQTAKTNIASAITTKGGTVASGDGFDDFASDIGSIPSGSEREAFAYRIISNTLNTEETIPSDFVFYGYNVNSSVFNGRTGPQTLTIPHFNRAVFVASNGFIKRINTHTASSSTTNDGVYACNNLESFIIYEDSNVTYINGYLIESCSKAKWIIIRKNLLLPANASYVISACAKFTNGTGRIFVLSDLVDSYKQAANWMQFSTLIYPLYIASTLAEKANYLADSSVINGSMIMCDEDDSFTVKGESA